MTKHWVGGERDAASRLARERKRHGWSLAQFAERLTEAGWAVGSGTLSKLENGRPGVALRVDHLAAITRVLDISADELLTPLELVDEAEGVRIADEVFAHMRQLHTTTAELRAALVRLDDLTELNPDAYSFVVRRLDSMGRHEGGPMALPRDVERCLDDLVHCVLDESLDRRGLKTPFRTVTFGGGIVTPDASWVETQGGEGDGEH